MNNDYDLDTLRRCTRYEDSFIIRDLYFVTVYSSIFPGETKKTLYGIMTFYNPEDEPGMHNPIRYGSTTEEIKEKMDELVNRWHEQPHRAEAWYLASRAKILAYTLKNTADLYGRYRKLKVDDLFDKRSHMNV